MVCAALPSTIKASLGLEDPPRPQSPIPPHVPIAGEGLTARLWMWMVRMAWLRLECPLRACAEVRRLCEPAGTESCRGTWREPPMHTPAPQPSTLQEQLDDSLQALKLHAELVFYVETTSFAPAQG